MQEGLLSSLPAIIFATVQHFPANSLFAGVVLREWFLIIKNPRGLLGEGSCQRLSSRSSATGRSQAQSFTIAALHCGAVIQKEAGHSSSENAWDYLPFDNKRLLLLQ